MPRKTPRQSPPRQSPRQTSRQSPRQASRPALRQSPRGASHKNRHKSTGNDPRKPAHGKSAYGKPIRKKPAYGKPRRGRASPQGDSILIHGRHAVASALANPARRITALYCTREAEEWLAGLPRPAAAMPSPRIVSRGELDAMMRKSLDDAAHHAHQGVVLAAMPLAPPALEDFLAGLAPGSPAILILLDHITDARNIGAIMRSARAFGAAALITTERGSAGESGALIKAASGAFEAIPLIPVVNLARAIELLKSHNFTIAGMAAQGDAGMDALRGHDRLGICMGAEGAGLRRLTAERADMLVRIPLTGGDDFMDSLNVSAAAAVALYAATSKEV